ncbi:surface-adhesin E family protein [Psychrobacter sp. FDAARGOS_221]|uniref:surface-adhesin E family protein n=1 Tax=Psychrobacter sp. FDAARGOS_221 TaxID=1975705 RepID=UPI000BB58C69|nr:surface-adhesin E family protein [Psychrobacter sp. FDAARGOS_221]PNK59507.1 hypothetical protein A6J60_000465 [Psychrobacter sp. FDAARGOS_221]
MKKLLSMLVVSAISISANANNWVNLGITIDDTTQFEIDTDSVKQYRTNQDPNGVYFSAFVKHIYLKGNYLNAGYKFSQQFYVVDCQQNRYTQTAYIAYGLNNEVKKSHQSEYITPENIHIAFPGTMVEQIVLAVCSHSVAVSQSS